MLAVLVLVGIVGGYLAGWVRVPRVVGYLVAGAVLHQAIAAAGQSPADDQALVEPFDLLNDIALGLIVFMIGSVFEMRRIKVIWPVLWRISVFEIGATFVLVGLGVAVAAALTLDVSSTTTAAIAMLLAAVAIATAPAATYLVLREFEAKGPTTEHILGLVGLNNLISILLFNAAFFVLAATGWLGHANAPDNVWLQLLSLMAGSMALGAVAGGALSFLHARVSVTETVSMFVALLLLLTAAEDWLYQSFGVTYNPLICMLIMGATFSNLTLNPQRFEDMLATIGSPMFVLFFVLAGFNLHFEDLPHLGWVGGAYLLLRAAGKFIGVYVAVRPVADRTRVRPTAGAAMLCQAGVAIGLGAFLVKHWPGETAEQINTVILAAVAASELIGPILVKATVVRAGEVKVATLLRPGAIRNEGLRPVALIRKRIGRTIGRRSEQPADSQDLTARHLMRTNVRTLTADAEFDHVLRFVEQSHLNDFPVVDADGRYLGIVHFQSMRDLMYNSAMALLVTAADLADTEIPPAPADTRLANLLELFNQRNVGILAVVDSAETNRLIGIIEQRDVLQAMHGRKA